jgi:hypothetical protein
MSDEKIDFDEMMALMGVRPIGAPPSGKRGRGGQPAANANAQPSERTNNRTGEGTNARALPAASAQPPVGAPSSASFPTSSTASTATAASKAAAASGRASPSLELRLGEAEAALRSSAAAYAAQAAALAAQAAALSEAQAQVAGLTAKLKEVEEHRSSLHQRFEARTTELEALKAGQQSEEDASFTAMLTDRGLAPRTEADLFLRAVADAHLGAKLVGLLSTHERSALQAFLDDSLALRGGCPACPDPAGRALMRVVRSRCDLCEGSDMRRRAAELTDALLVAGHNRLVFVGGSPAYYTQLDKLLIDRRIRVTKVPNGRNIRKEDAKSQLQNSDLIVIWGSTIIDHRVTELYTKQPADKARVITIAHRGMTGMMERLTRTLRSEGDA